MKNLTQNIRSISGIIVTLGLLLAGSIQEVSAQAAANAPKLTTTIQDHGNPGAIIQVNGTNLNRGSNGLTWAGQAPYAVQMTGQNGQPVNCTFRFINIGRIDVTIPATAISSRIRLVQGGYTSLINRSIRVTRAIPAGKGVLTIDNLSQYNILGVQLNIFEQPHQIVTLTMSPRMRIELVRRARHGSQPGRDVPDCQQQCRRTSRSTSRECQRLKWNVMFPQLPCLK